MCLYCDVDYDVIGKLEYFDEDMDYIAEKLNITEKLRLLHHIQHKTPERGHSSRRQKRDKYMSQLSQGMVQALHQLYEIDFLMFDYYWNFNITILKIFNLFVFSTIYGPENLSLQGLNI